MAHAMLSSHRLTPSLSADLLYQFPRRPQHFFLIKKSGSSHVDSKASELASYLRLTHHLTVYVERSVSSAQSALFPGCVAYDAAQHRQVVEVVVTLGGDGTALHFNSLFNDSHTIPVLLSFSMGTLGFLTPFDFARYKTIVSQLLKAHTTPTRNDQLEPKKGQQNGQKEGEGEGEGEGGEFVISLCPRMRLLCQVWKQKKKPHRDSTEEERLAREAQRRRKRRMSHGISGDDDDDSTSSEEEEDDAEREEGAAHEQQRGWASQARGRRSRRSEGRREGARGRHRSAAVQGRPAVSGARGVAAGGRHRRRGGVRPPRRGGRGLSTCTWPPRSTR